jgi:Ca2+-binding RTX toxin-like protein
MSVPRWSRAAALVGISLVVAAGPASPAAAVDGDDLGHTLAVQSCFGVTYRPPQYDVDGHVLVPGTPGVLFVPAGNAIFYGTSGNDIIIGTSGPDRIFAMEGNDIICAGDGDDRVEGDENLFSAIGGGDRIDGAGGLDKLFGAGGNDIIHGGPNRYDPINEEHLEGGFGVDWLFGGPGNDFLVCQTLLYSAQEPYDYADGGTGMAGGQAESDSSLQCPNTVDIEYSS